MSHLLTLDHIRAAHERILDSIVATPTLHSQTLSKLTGANIYLKFENLQFTAAYKERGALNALLLLTDEQRSKASAIMAPASGSR
jgi:threonine dehydratase